MANGVTSAGMASGLPLEEIITKSIEARRMGPERRMNEAKERVDVEISGVGILKSSLYGLYDDVMSNGDPSIYNKSVVSSGQNSDMADFVEVISDSMDSLGNHSIEVRQLAQGSYYRMPVNSLDDPISIFDTNLGFRVGRDTFYVDIEAGDSYATVVDKINKSPDNIGVRAQFIAGKERSHLIFESDILGSGHELEIFGGNRQTAVFEEGILSGYEVIQSSKDAIVVFDGVEVRHSSNEIENISPGLSLNLKSVTQSPLRFSVDQDVEHVIDSLNTFVTKYNEIISTFDQLSFKAPIIGGERQGESGLLANDASVPLLQSLFSTTILSEVDNNPSYKNILELGFDVDRKGKLSFNASTFQEKMVESSEDVAQFFSGYNGLFDKFSDVLYPYVRVGGLLYSREDGLRQEKGRVLERESSFNYQMDLYEKNLRRQYSELDTQIGRLNNVQKDLASRLG